MKKRIYFDNAATTPIDKNVSKFLKKCNVLYGNPSSLHYEGRVTKALIENSRNQCAQALGCLPEEIFFTSGASESNSWAYKIWPLHYDNKVHDSLRVYGYNSDIYAVSFMNNETGRLDVQDYLDKNIFVDLTSAIGHTNIDLHSMPNVVGASLSGHKFGALTGTGLLYVKQSEQAKMQPLIIGHQENTQRGGTENVLGIISLGIAIQESTNNIKQNNMHIYELATYIYNKALSLGLKVNTNHHIVNITFDNVSALTAVAIFDRYGVAISAGSACNSDTDTPSAILLENGYTDSEALRTIRISLGRNNTLKECKKFIQILSNVIDKYDRV